MKESNIMQIPLSLHEIYRFAKLKLALPGERGSVVAEVRNAIFNALLLLYSFEVLLHLFYATST